MKNTIVFQQVSRRGNEKKHVDDATPLGLLFLKQAKSSIDLLPTYNDQ
jgi:hypothetical protein